jgi:hypothetical protein
MKGIQGASVVRLATQRDGDELRGAARILGSAMFHDASAHERLTPPDILPQEVAEPLSHENELGE